MKPLSNIDDCLKLLVVNEVTYAIDSIQVGAQCMQSENSLYNQCRTTSDLKHVPKTSVLMPSTIQIHRKVLLSNAKILKETKFELYKMLQNYDTIISEKVIMI